MHARCPTSKVKQRQTHRNLSTVKFDPVKLYAAAGRARLTNLRSGFRSIVQCCVGSALATLDDAAWRLLALGGALIRDRAAHLTCWFS